MGAHIRLKVFSDLDFANGVNLSAVILGTLVLSLKDNNNNLEWRTTSSIQKISKWQNNFHLFWIAHRCKKHSGNGRRVHLSPSNIEADGNSEAEVTQL